MPPPADASPAPRELVADLLFARECEQLGKLALLAYCDVKRWARETGRSDVAEMSVRLVSESASMDKQTFLRGIDGLLRCLQPGE